MIEVHDGSLSYNGWTSVIYNGKVFPAPTDSVVLMSWDYIVNLIRTGEMKKWFEELNKK